MEAVLGISEGPIQGLKNGAKSFFIGDTALQGESGQNNFDNFELVVRKGSELGEPINSRLGGFGASKNVQTELATGTPVVRTGSLTDIDYLDVRLVINRLVRTNDKGDFEHSGQIRVEFKPLSSVSWQPANNFISTSPVSNTSNLVDAFYGISDGQGVNRQAINASPGDRPTFLSSEQPISTASAAVWFDSSDNYRPKMFNGSSWYFPTNLQFADNRWTWTEPSSWGGDKSTSAYVLPTVAGRPYEQGDYWIDVANGRVLFFNGSAWIIAGTSLAPGSFGSNNTGGSVGVNNGTITIKGKTTAPFVKEFRVPVSKISEPYMIRVTKLSPANTTEEFFDIVWESFQEVTAKTYTFPGLATTQLVARASEQFSSIPDFSGVYLGRIVRVPSNYNPTTRTYTGVWDGTWKLAYTNNPAYIVYDLVSNTRYGMNAYYPITLNKQDIYEAGQWCDTLTADGLPRFTYNGIIADPRGGRDAVNYLCGLFGGRFFDDGNGQGVIKLDRDDAASLLFTPENVVDGVFSYSFTEISTRHNDITVTFTNPDLNWQEDRRRVFDQDHIDKYGRIPSNFVAVGCTDEREAIVRGRYKLVTGTTETMMVSFKTNRLGLYASPYDVILISDEDMGTGLSGRVAQQTSATTFTLRDPLFLEPGFTYRVRFSLISDLTGQYEVESRDIDPSLTGAVTSITVLQQLPDLPEHATFTIEQANGDAAPMAFRILSITEADGDPDNVEIQAIQMNRAKWLFVDGVVDSIGDLDEYTLGSKKRPEPPPAVRVRPTQRIVGTNIIHSIYLDWDPSTTKSVTQYKILGSRDNATMSVLGSVNVTQFEWDNVPAGEYVFQVIAIDFNGQESQPAVIEHRLIGDVRVIEDVTTLRLVDEPSATIFESRSPVVQWPPSTSSYHKSYVVQVRTPDDLVLRTEELTETSYRYEFAANIADNGGTPRRTFKIAVASKDTFGFISAFSEILISNPAPEAPFTQSVTQIAAAAVISFEPPSIRDFQGLVIHMSQTSGFVPNETNRVFKGTSNNVPVLITPGETYYFRIAFYDVFGDQELNFGPQLSLNTSGTIEDTTPPAQPTNVTASPGIGVAILNWDNPPDQDLNLIEIYYSTTNDVSAAQYGVVSFGESAVVPSLVGNQTYYFFLRSLDTNGNRSPFTAAVSTTPSMPIAATVIDDNSITTPMLAANAVTADKIAANSITADKLNVNTLSAITANIGTITSGVLQSADGKMIVNLTDRYILISDNT